MHVLLFASTLESLEIPIATDIDPTGSTIQFALSTADASTPGTFADGSWATEFGATQTGWTVARTPLIGGGDDAALTITSGSTYDVWYKIVSLGGETPVAKCGSITCP